MTGDLTIGGGDLTVGSTNVISDSGGSCSLKGIDSIDATTEATIESAIDTLSNLTSASSLSTIGTISTGTWQGSIINRAYGGTGLNTSSISNGQLLIGSSSGFALANILWAMVSVAFPMVLIVLLLLTHGVRSLSNNRWFEHKSKLKHRYIDTNNRIRIQRIRIKNNLY